jgi:hypothetical protein
MMRVAFLLLLLINLLLYSANSGLLGAPQIAGLRNPGPLASELNPAAAQVRPLAPGEFDDHPVVGPAVPNPQVTQAQLPRAEAAAHPDSAAHDASGASSSPLATRAPTQAASAPSLPASATAAKAESAKSADSADTPAASAPPPTAPAGTAVRAAPGSGSVGAPDPAPHAPRAAVPKTPSGSAKN